MTGQMRILDHSGDTLIEWDTDVKAQVARAQEQFALMIREGYTAYAFKQKGQPGEVVKTFDPDTERIIVHPPLAGG